MKNCEEREQYLNIQTVPITDEHFKEITKLLNKHEEIALTTAFNYVDDYVWFEEEGKEQLHTRHCLYLLGENDDSYFIAESPCVLLDAGKLQMESNNSIFRIAKKHFAEAFQKYCVINVLNFKNIPSNKKAELEYFMAICREIAICYEIEDSIEKAVIGRKALLLLKKEIEEKNKNIISDYYLFHIIISRRVIFKRCFELFRTYINGSSGINGLLKLSIEHWKKMKDLTYEYHYCYKMDFDAAIQEMYKLIEIEDALAKEISNIQWKYSNII